MRRIKQISFKGNKTEIKFYSSEQKRGYNEVVEEKNTITSDLIRHKHFQEAFENMAPHLAIAYGFADTMDRIDYPLNMEWFSNRHWEDDVRFNKLNLTSVLVTGKYAVDGIKLIGTIESPSEALLPLKTEPISLVKELDGYNYRCQLELDSQWETLELEAQEFLKGKTGATAIQTSMNLDKPLPQAAEPKMTMAKKTMASAGVPLTN